jgi:spermidine synthase
MSRLGTHWLARAAGCPPDRLGSAARLADVLRELPDALGLTRVGEPIVHARPEGGVAGVVLLSESHASLHASPADGTLFADIFSCAPFDAHAAARFLERAFRPETLRWEVLDRGPVAPRAGLQERPDGRLVVVDETWPDRRALDLEVTQVVFDGYSEHQHVLVVDTPALGRVLYLDGVLQSAERDEAVYHRALVQPAMAAHSDARRVLIAGGGEGAAAREVLRHTGVRRARMVDFDRVVVDVCAAHLPALGAWDDPRIEVVHRDFFADLSESPGVWDVILVDLIDEALDRALSPVHRRQLQEGLAPGGVVAVSLGPLRSGVRDRLAAFRDSFPQAAPYSTWLESHSLQWGFAVSKPPTRPLAFGPDTWAGLSWLP